MTLGEFLKLLQERGLKPRQLSSGQWLSLCPAHEDHQPSLSITEGEKGVLLNCFAGCSVRDICSALQISERDLFTDSGQLSTPRGCTIADLAQNCQVLQKTLIELGCREVQYGGAPAVAFPFQTSDGRVFYHYRIAVDGGDKWRLQVGAPAKELVFAFPQALERIQQTRSLFITESPLDAAVLFAIGFPAIATIGKGNASVLTNFRHLLPQELTIIVFQEPDAETFAQEVADALGRTVLCLVSPNPNIKDPWRMLRANNGDIERTRSQIEFALSNAFEVQPTPRTLAEILDRIVGFIRKYVILTPEQADALALWAAHTWAIEAAETTPYLRITSATKRCGKTRLAEVLSCLVREPVFTTCLTPAAMFRIIHQKAGAVTLILDEVEGTFAGRELGAQLSALLNSGWRRGLRVPRVERLKSGEFVIREYLTFSPKILVGLGKLADTVEDRTMQISLQRKKPDERVHDFFWQRATEEAKPIREALADFFGNEDVIAQLRFTFPSMPCNISDRAREGWRLLVAIADLAGQAWGEKARKAMQALERTREDSSSSIRLLQAIRQIFMEKKAERLFIQEIAEGLAELAEPPVPEEFWRWFYASDWRRIGIWLAKVLRPFGIQSSRFREGGESRRGYDINAFADAWARYLSEETVSPDTEGVPTVPTSHLESERENASKIRHCSNRSNCSEYNIRELGTNSITLTNDKEYGINSQGNEQDTNPQGVPTSILRSEQLEQSEQSLILLGFSRSNLETGVGTVGTNSPTNLPQQKEVGQLEWFRCPRCGLRRLMSPDSWLLAGRCPECGADLLPDQPEPPSGGSPSRQVPTDDASEPTDGERFVDTLKWLEREIGFANSTDFAGNSPPQTEPQTKPEPDQPPRKTKLPPSSCRQLANDLLHILREFQRSSKKHQRCLTDPCPTCRAKARQVRYLERANSRNGLRALWQRAQAWQQQQGGVGA